MRSGCRSFMSYFCEFFDDVDDVDFLYFKKFKNIAKANLKLWDTWDPLDYAALKKICCPATNDLYTVAEICYAHNETYFREQIMTWLEMAREAADKFGADKFTRSSRTF